MAILWFENHPSVPASGPEGICYSSDGHLSWAVLSKPFVHAELADESADLLSLYGAYVGLIGRLLETLPAPIPMALEEWGQCESRPTSEVGLSGVELLLIDGTLHTAATRIYANVKVILTTTTDSHLIILAPTSAGLVRLVSV